MRPPSRLGSWEWGPWAVPSPAAPQPRAACSACGASGSWVPRARPAADPPLAGERPHGGPQRGVPRASLAIPRTSRPSAVNAVRPVPAPPLAFAERPISIQTMARPPAPTAGTPGVCGHNHALCPLWRAGGAALAVPSAVARCPRLPETPPAAESRETPAPCGTPLPPPGPATSFQGRPDLPSQPERRRGLRAPGRVVAGRGVDGSAPGTKETPSPAPRPRMWAAPPSGHRPLGNGMPTPQAEENGQGGAQPDRRPPHPGGPSHHLQVGGPVSPPLPGVS